MDSTQTSHDDPSEGTRVLGPSKLSETKTIFENPTYNDHKLGFTKNMSEGTPSGVTNRLRLPGNTNEVRSGSQKQEDYFKVSTLLGQQNTLMAHD